LEYRRGELLKDRTELEKRIAPMQEMGFALDPEDEKKLLDINEKLLQVNQQISAEKQAQEKSDKAQAEADEKKVKAEKDAQAEWMRGRKLDKMSAGDRVSFINDEISALRQQPGSIENRERMRKLIDERDAAQKDADAFKEKKNDFLHRNDTDAQRMASIGKQLAEAGASGDQAKMLELMMAGEDLAENYQEPQTKRQQRRAEKKAERDARAAMREARKMRKQIAGVEAAWGAGDKSAAEKLAGMTTDASGHVTIRQVNDKGKMVEVKGIDATNTILDRIEKLLK